MTKKSVIAYSLYGTQEKYLSGALRNIEQSSHFYPGWIPRFYVGRSVGQSLTGALTTAGAEVVCVDGREDASAMFWRYKAFFDPQVAIVQVRDADSRLSLRETEAVMEWIDSGAGFHIMRDHPAHYCAILGGLWGGRTDRMKDLRTIFDRVNPRGLYGEDQQFLREYVYPMARRDSMVHDSFFAFERHARRFPSARKGLEFVGEVFDEIDQPRREDREVLSQAESSGLRRLRLKYSSLIRGLN